MKLTLRGKLALVALVAVTVITMGAVVSYACGLPPLPDPPGWRPAVTSP